MAEVTACNPHKEEDEGYLAAEAGQKLSQNPYPKGTIRYEEWRRGWQIKIDALRLMRDGGFRHVPVVDNGTLVGVVSRGDFRGLEQDRLDEETGLWERIG